MRHLGFFADRPALFPGGDKLLSQIWAMHLDEARGQVFSFLLLFFFFPGEEKMKTSFCPKYKCTSMRLAGRCEGRRKRRKRKAEEEETGEGEA